MRKIMPALIMGLLIATSAVAEESSWFVGGQLGQSSVELSWTTKVGNRWISSNQKQSSIRYGILAGRKSFFTENFGLRYYIGVNLGSYEGVSAKDFQINVDAVYNFVEVGGVPIGAFAGVGSGYKTYDYPVAQRWGLIVNVNLGVRATIAEHHGVELFYTHDMTAANMGDKFVSTYFEYLKPNIFGVRYTYSF